MIPMLRQTTFILALMLAAGVAQATKIADVTRLYGQQNNVLTGIGLIYGLKGTGDGGDYLPAIRPLQAMLEKYNNPVTLKELDKSVNVALVTVTATLPSNGVRRGDRIDVYLTSMGAASSLRGGRLILTPLTGRPGGPVYGLAEGGVLIEDAATPTVGLIKQGLIVEEDLKQPLIRGGREIMLVIDESAASWGLASNIATVINEAEADGQVIAVVIDPRTVAVQIPEHERQRPDGFISRVQSLPVQALPQEARVVINTRTNAIIVTGDVEISPVVISYKGLTITTVTPRSEPTPRTPQVTVQNAVPLSTTPPEGNTRARLQDLVSALEQLKVAPEDRINIVRDLHKSGKLHAKLIIDGVMP
jgi:flagellar P-ring protein FlgI